MKIRVGNSLNTFQYRGEFVLEDSDTSIAFSEIEKFPLTRGVYIIYDENLGDIVYVGSAYAHNRTIMKRCEQYIWDGSGGTFRIKIEKRLNLTTDEAKMYIKKNCRAWFKKFSANASVKEIKRLEHLLIGLINPIDND